MSLLRKFQPVLPRSFLLTIYKTFIRSQLDYVDVLYDQAYNSYFHEKPESIQCNACFAIREAIRRTSSKKLDQYIRLESLKSKRWRRKLCHFYKILTEKSPSYLFSFFPNLNRVHETRHSNNILVKPDIAIHVKHDDFKNSFFSSSISEWKKVGWKIRNSESLSTFEKSLLNFKQSCTNNIHNPCGIKLLGRLRLGFSYLCDQKFRDSFQDPLKPLCGSGNDTKTITHFFLYYPSFHPPRQTLLNNIRNINEQILSHGKDQLIQKFLYGNTNCNLTVHRLILKAVIE